MSRLLTPVKTVEFREGALWLLDQTRLPLQTELIECRQVSQVAEAIRSLRVRGAPAIGLAAAYGVALGAERLASEGLGGQDFERGVQQVIAELRQTRPTAVNLFWALERMRSIMDAHPGAPSTEVAEALRLEADRMLAEDEEANRAMGRLGADLIPAQANILTHCNTGALATGAWGTALGVVRAAHEQGKQVHVWVDETRPLLQGARLTTWELQQLGIPHTLITDNMAAHFMSRGEVDLAIVGADHIAANGDTANKIGTYGVAVLARAHDIPFYVAAPTSTVDRQLANGKGIPIEQRQPEEVRAFREAQVAPLDTAVANPAFDVTPAQLITAIITERGVVRPPYVEGLARIAG